MNHRDRGSVVRSIMGGFCALFKVNKQIHLCKLDTKHHIFYLIMDANGGDLNQEHSVKSYAILCLNALCFGRHQDRMRLPGDVVMRKSYFDFTSVIGKMQELKTL